MPRSLTPTWSVMFFLLVVSLIVLLNDMVAAAELCTPTYCVCLGECPESYETAYNRANSISNGEQYVCYATNGTKFAIGGKKVVLNGGETTVRMQDLAPCVPYSDTTISTLRSYDTALVAAVPEAAGPPPQPQPADSWGKGGKSGGSRAVVVSEATTMTGVVLLLASLWSLLVVS